jgi:energy-coupling factor transport system ATP-binding protein
VAVIDPEGRLALDASPEDAFVTHRGALDALGVWDPQLAVLAGLLAGGGFPRSTAEAATTLARAWPRGGAEAVPSPARSGPPLLETRSVTYRYRGTAPALEDVSLAIRPGELVAIVGRNGAGKSTLGLVLAGVLRPSAGSVLLDGRDLRAHRRDAVRARLAYVFQYPEHQFVARTAREEIAWGLRARGLDAADARRRADAELERAGLGPLALAEPHSLSLGQQRRLSVATALVTDPEVIVLDEPTFGQDRRHYDALARRLDDLHGEGRTVVLITHDLGLVADHAGRAVALADGRVAFDGSTRELFARDDVLARCGLVLPPVARAFRSAREARPDLPAVIGLRDARGRLGLSA